MKQTAVAAEYGKLPLSFEANQGQTDPRVKFLSRGDGYSLFLTDSGAVLALRKGPKFTSGARAPNAWSGLNVRAEARTLRQGKASGEPEAADVVRMELVGASKEISVSGADKLPGIANYFIGSDRSKWRSDVPTFSKVKYASVYPGVDLVYYGNQKQLEYDFVVAPHADAKMVRMRFTGAQNLRLTADGDLALAAQNGEIAFHKPVIYQLVHGKREPVQGQYELLAQNEVGFALGRYDAGRELVIDPTLSYSTYLGGSGQGGDGSFDDNGYAIAADSAGDVFVTGETWSQNFPVTSDSYSPSDPGLFGGFFQTSVGFVSELNSTGTALVYSTYIGGDGASGYTGDETNGGGGDSVNAICVDSSGAAYITGETWSQNFPTTSGAFQTSNKAFPYAFNAFVTKLNPAGNKLEYSTFLGGTAQPESNNDYGDAGYGIAVNSSGNAYVTGLSTSKDFPVTSKAYQKVNKAASNVGGNAWVAELAANGESLIYSTYLGGSGIASVLNPPARNHGAGLPGDAATALALDSEGDVYVTGYSLSTDFPVTSGAYQAHSDAAANGLPTGFVAKLDPTGSALDYSTYLGGSGDKTGDIPHGISVDLSGDAHVAGATGSSDFPTTKGALQTKNNGGSENQPNAFVTKLNAGGTALVYSTFLGGTGNSVDGDRAEAIAVDSLGEAFVTGYASSTNFPVTANAYQSTNKAAGNHGANAFLSELNAAGSALSYSTYLGGSGGAGSGKIIPPGGDVAYGIALDGAGGVYLVGDAYSSNFPTTKGAFQTTNNGASGGNSNLFISKLGPFVAPVAATPVFSPAAGTYLKSVAVTITDATSGAVIYYTTDGSTPTTSSTKYTAAITVSATETIKAIAVATDYSDSSVASATYTIDAGVTATPVFSPTAGSYGTELLVTLTDSTAGAVIYYTTNGATPTTSSTKYSAPITVSTTETVKAIAVAAKYETSAVASASYTIAGTPTVLIALPTSVTTSGATLNALVSSGDVAGSYSFAYGTSSSALTSATASKSFAASAGQVDVSAALTGLKAKTTYYFRAVVTTVGGSATSAILNFTTE